MKLVLKKIFWGSAFVVSLFFVVIYFQRYLAARQWHKAHKLACSGKYQEAGNIYSNIYPKLKWNGRFLSYYGNILLQNKKYGDAINLFEKAKFTYPDPYMFENLGVAYLSVKIPQPTPDIKSGCSTLKKGDCINRAIYCWMLSSDMQPWRLTPKYYLADLFHQLGDTSNAMKYARLVVNTPMKKWTERGKEFKLKSQKMLVALGQKCDDPRLIVFDINDKETWNEGKW